jgi:hypothetical protein
MVTTLLPWPMIRYGQQAMCDVLRPFSKRMSGDWQSRRLGKPALGYLEHALVAPVGPFLAGQAEWRPRHGRQTLPADFLIAVQARSKSTAFDTG